MTCQEFPLIDFVDGLLDSESQSAVTTHLEECPSCAARVEAMNETRARLQQAEPLAVPQQFERRLDTCLRRDDLKREGIKLLAFGLAAVAALLRLFLARLGNGRTSVASASSDKEGRQTNL
ncbi:MAG: zf-HC2 domain-containing protein [Chloroflexota bacterium]|nr:zf-HC2 domain-containing protein [Chloroflexota bacterium]